jgi:hypothetical protein
METNAERMAAARTTPHESKTRPMPEPNLCAECGLSPWDDVHIRSSQARTMAARKARHLNALRRKADEYEAGLTELGYIVIHPDDKVAVLTDLLRRLKEAGVS